LGILIPPSVGLVLFGIITGESIGALLIAGIIPGIISAVGIASFISISVIMRPSLVQISNVEEMEFAAHDNAKRTTLKDHHQTDDATDVKKINTNASKIQSVGSFVQLALLFGIVVGGIYGGFLTATESGAVASFAAAVLLGFKFRKSIRAFMTNMLHAIRESLGLIAMKIGRAHV